MALERNMRPLTQCVRCTRHNRAPTRIPIRALATTSDPPPSTTEAPPVPPPEASTPSATNANGINRSGRNPFLVHTPRSERDLLRTKNQQPIGSRRRRAALASTNNIPFSQLPYQCFQEARKVLQEDRQEKVEEIERTREKIARVEESLRNEGEGDVALRARKEHVLRTHRQRLEQLKIYADINDPVVKKRFEDGFGDMTKPIYRHLARLQWESMKRKLLVQRITQMDVVPDVLPYIEPTVSTTLSFNNKKIPHGDFVLSTLSETPPTLEIQPFDKGERFISIAVVNPDVPNVEKDGFDYRCHFLASNISISPTNTHIDLAALDQEKQVIIPWLPPHAQKGAPYQRLCIFVLEQHSPSITPNSLNPPQPSSSSPPPGGPEHGVLDVAHIKSRGRYTVRENFILRSFVDKHGYTPVGVDLFRTQWDEGTAGVMERAGLVGSDVEFRRKRVEALPYKRVKGERFR